MTNLSPITPNPQTSQPSLDDPRSQLSALIDGELDDPRARALLGSLVRDQAERARFSEYAMIGDLLRGHRHDTPDLTARVMGALEYEPTVLAPMTKRPNRRPALWLAAATVAAITWALWSAPPNAPPTPPMAANAPGVLPTAGVESGSVMPYLAAHQDFAQAVVSPSEMRLTRVNLAGAGQ
jgi:negative regulator of sigma E activity